jgi:hypothetical protein
MIKKILAGLCVISIVIFALLALIDLEPYLAPKKNLAQDTPARLNEEKPKQNANDRLAGLKEQIKSAPTVVVEAPATESIRPKAVSESPLMSKIDAEPTPADKIISQPMVAAIPIPADSQPTLNTTPKSTDKATPDSIPVRPAKEAINLEIAVTPEGTYPFSILLETLDEPATAQQAIALYRKQGIASFWVKVDLGKAGLKYRLFSGMFPTEAAAQTFLDQHHLTGKFVKNASYTAKIGFFHDQKDLALMFIKTAEAGVFPYVMGMEKGPFHLYVGAFYTADGADNQCRELIGKGLPCKAVTRSTLPSKS